MYKVLILILVSVIISSCFDKKEKTILENIIEKKQHPDSKENIVITNYFIKDSIQYSEGFLNEFKKKHSMYKKVALIKDSIIINNDTVGVILLPKKPKTNSELLFKSDEFLIKIIRINRTDILYTISNESKNYKQNGNVILDPVFYYGSNKTFEDDKGDTYQLFKYFEQKNGCSTTIFVGNENYSLLLFKSNCLEKEIALEANLLR